MERVQQEEKGLVDADQHERTDKKIFHSAVRDAQKKWRLQDYGIGKKSNTVTEDLLDY